MISFIFHTSSFSPCKTPSELRWVLSSFWTPEKHTALCHTTASCSWVYFLFFNSDKRTRNRDFSLHHTLYTCFTIAWYVSGRSYCKGIDGWRKGWGFRYSKTFTQRFNTDVFSYLLLLSFTTFFYFSLHLHIRWGLLFSFRGKSSSIFPKYAGGL